MKIDLRIKIKYCLLKRLPRFKLSTIQMSIVTLFKLELDALRATCLNIIGEKLFFTADIVLFKVMFFVETNKRISKLALQGRDSLAYHVFTSHCSCFLYIFSVGHSGCEE